MLTNRVLNWFLQIMIGILFFLFEFYDDQLLAFMVLILVWLSELFTLIRSLSLSPCKYIATDLRCLNSYTCCLWLRSSAYMWPKVAYLMAPHTQTQKKIKKSV